MKEFKLALRLDFMEFIAELDEPNGRREALMAAD